jgi:hypothetical protein
MVRVIAFVVVAAAVEESDENADVDTLREVHLAVPPLVAGDEGVGNLHVGDQANSILPSPAVSTAVTALISTPMLLTVSRMLALIFVTAVVEECDEGDDIETFGMLHPPIPKLFAGEERIGEANIRDAADSVIVVLLRGNDRTRKGRTSQHEKEGQSFDERAHRKLNKGVVWFKMQYLKEGRCRGKGLIRPICLESTRPEDGDKDVFFALM